VRIVCISDTHSHHERIVVPEGDVLIHAGDLTRSGTQAQIHDTYIWLAGLPHERIIVTPGNHDFELDRNTHLLQMVNTMFPRIETLVDSETMLGGMRVWGSPWTPWFNDWSFIFASGPAGEKEARAKWDEIPDDTAILVTHGPPYGIGDATQHGWHVGCPALKARTAQLPNLRLHVFGHVHEAYGAQRVGDVLYVNACSCDVLYYPRHPPIVVDIDETGARAPDAQLT
jgi:Icc-related predicted phosphoesterase